MEQEVAAFFREYEAANAGSDVARIGRLYADSFMFAGPKGVQSVRKEDFLRVIPKMKAYFASLGVRETRLNSVKATAINSRYVLANVSWRILMSNGRANRDFVDATASYVLDGQGIDGMAIIFQIDDQELAATVKEWQATRKSE